jgi:hypothetical protein
LPIGLEMPPLTPPQSVYDQIERLVKRFKARSTRERNAYNEDNARKDFILPMFRA